jgi:cytidine diphosphoramidate kinase
MKKVIWITGLSGSGKSTLGTEVVRLLRDKGDKVIYLDGDQLREVFGVAKLSKNNYKRDARLSIAMQYSRLCYIIANQGITVVIATISMFKEIHEWNRNNLPNYFEVFLKIPIEELRRRDSKNIYSKYDSGELRNVAGLDLKVDNPENPNLLFDFSKNYTIEEMANRLIVQIQE